MCEQSSCKCTPPKEDYTSIDYQLAILMALKEGKTLEIASRSSGRGQPIGPFIERSLTTPLNFSSACYRIKREPKVMWVNEYNTCVEWAIHTTQAAAKAGASHRATRVAVKYVEVLED